jgi:diguanylate cyclase (GGDEF)-like protein
VGTKSRVAWRRPDGAALTYLVMLLSGFTVTVVALVMIPQILVAGGHDARLYIGLGLIGVSGLYVLIAGRIPALALHLLTVITILSGNLVISCFDDPAMRAITASWNLLIILYQSTSLTRRAIVIYGTICVASAVELVLTVPATPALMVVRGLGVAGLVTLPIIFFMILRRELDAALAQAQALATKDSLTGLLNRRGMGEAFPLIGSASRRGARFVAVLVCDLDHFKRINDTLGHATGDEVLCQVAKTLPNCTRTEDLMVRLGGEEFAVIAAVHDEQGAALLGERLRAAVQRDCSRWGVTMSVGIALAALGSMQVHNGTLSDLLIEADGFLYEAKAAGRNRIRGPAARPLHVLPAD